MAVPGCPLPQRWTASAARTRAVSTARVSSSDQSSGTDAVVSEAISSGSSLSGWCGVASVTDIHSPVLSGTHGYLSGQEAWHRREGGRYLIPSCRRRRTRIETILSSRYAHFPVIDVRNFQYTTSETPPPDPTAG